MSQYIRKKIMPWVAGIKYIEIGFSISIPKIEIYNTKEKLYQNEEDIRTIIKIYFTINIDLQNIFKIFESVVLKQLLKISSTSLVAPLISKKFD